MDETLIFDWNHAAPATPPARVELNDETLRDGLQSPSVRIPPIEQKVRILHLLDRLSIDSANIGLPAAGPQVLNDAGRLADAIRLGRLGIRANCAARTLVKDIEPIALLEQRSGIPIECCCFIGASRARREAEGWTVEQLLRRTEDAVGFASGHGLAVMYVVEDATRTDPDTLTRLVRAAVDAGAARVCIADTAGHATPEGARAITRFTRRLLDGMRVRAGVDWHGHRDRDLGTINSLAALEAGADRAHGTVLGLGERAGNTPIDLLLVNLVLLGWVTRDLTPLDELVQLVAEATGQPVQSNYPIFGRDAFRTASGIHAAALAKAFRKRDRHLADTVHSGVPGRLVGRVPEIEVGPLSGRANVLYWLECRGIAADDLLVERVVSLAKRSKAVLTETEILHEVALARRRGDVGLEA